MIFNSIIPLPLYTPLFYNIVLFLIFFAFLKLQTTGYVIHSTSKKETSSLILLIAVTLYMGLRPISGRYFGDMYLYNHSFNSYQKGLLVQNGIGDIFWVSFMKLCSGIMTAEYFFLLCAALYIVPLFIACKKWLGAESYFLFLMLIASFSFWGYGVNGIRNGIATSLFILALSFKDKKYLTYAILFISYNVHGSMIIPIAAYVLTLFYKNPKHYLLGWLLCISLSLIFGGVWESLFASLGYGGDRAGYLTMEGFEDQFSYTGFRWDFLLYSVSAVYTGYYFIVKKQFNEKLYIQLFNIYVTANAFWILVIRAPYSNRFAYLSWFLMAIIIFYPFFKQQFFKQQQKVLAYIMLLYFGFTYFMFLIT